MQHTTTHLKLPYLKHIVTKYDSEKRILWYWLTSERPCFSSAVLADIKVFQDAVRDIVTAAAGDETPVHYLVGGSETPGVFNLGGDLEYFVSLIRAKDRQSLLTYGLNSIDILFANASNLQLPATTISLVQGQAMGGGFEAALSSNIIVAERQATFGFPEVLFNLIPGMGAYNLLARRVDIVTTERILTSGLNYTAEQLFKWGVIDVLAENGDGENAVRRHIASRRNRRRADQLLCHIRNRVNPLSMAALRDVVHLWVDAALSLSERDLRIMERLVATQIDVFQPALTASRVELMTMSGST